MHVYRTFFHVFRQHMGYVILYLCIFMGVALVISSNKADDSGKKNWVAVCYPFAVFDKDRSEVSKELISYIERGNKRVEMKDSEEAVTDELYAHNLVCVLRIPKGFGDSIESGREDKTVEISTVPGSIYSRAFQNLVQDYISLVTYYLEKGDGLAEALKQIEELREIEVPVTVEERGGDELHGRVYYFFLYLPYILISICVVGIGPSMMAFQKKEIKYRNRCSAYPDIRMNMEIFLASVTVGFLFCIIYFLLVLLGTGSEVLSFKGFLYTLNMISFLPAALGITFLCGQAFQTITGLTMAANVIGLGMSFLGGVFAPVEFLGERLAKAAHLLPVYWYTYGNRLIDNYVTGKSLNDLWQCMGVQILFGVAVFCVGLAWLRSMIQENMRNAYK